MLEKLSAAMGDAFTPGELGGALGANGLEAGPEGAAIEEGEEEEEEEEEPNVHSAASSGARGVCTRLARAAACAHLGSLQRLCHASPMWDTLHG